MILGGRSIVIVVFTVHHVEETIDLLRRRREEILAVVDTDVAEEDVFWLADRRRCVRPSCVCIVQHFPLCALIVSIRVTHSLCSQLYFLHETCN